MNLTKLVKILGAALIVDPLFRILFFKLSTKLEFSVVWNNIIDNSLSSPTMFLEYWVLAPLTGVLLLSSFKIGQHLYMLLTFFNAYSLMTYKAFTWPYFSKTPHWSAFLLMAVNLVIVSVFYWPLVKKYILSRHLRHLWDARGRYHSDLDGSMFIDKKGFEVSGRIKNISSGGLLFIVGMEVGLLAAINDEGLVIIRDEENVFISLKFKVVNHRMSDGECSLGIEFTDVNSSLRLKILELLQKNSFNGGEFYSPPRKSEGINIA